VRRGLSGRLRDHQAGQLTAFPRERCRSGWSRGAFHGRLAGMKERLLAVCLLLAWPAALPAERTVREITTAADPQNDARPNSDAVPEVYAIPARIEKVLVLRFKYKSDLLEGLRQMVKKHSIRNAVILAGAGSVRGYHVHAVSNAEFPSKNVFVKDPAHPADIVSMNGYIIDGRVHAHITLADRDKAFGGHLEPGTDVFTFAIVTLGVFGDEVTLDRVDDKTYR